MNIKEWSPKSGWIRLGIALSLLWFCLVAIAVVREYSSIASKEGTFVHLVERPELHSNTDIPIADPLRDAIPLKPSIKWGAASLFGLLPVISAWLLAGLANWVIKGFRNRA